MRAWKVRALCGACDGDGGTWRFLRQLLFGVAPLVTQVRLVTAAAGQYSHGPGRVRMMPEKKKGSGAAAGPAGVTGLLAGRASRARAYSQRRPGRHTQVAATGEL